MLGTGNSHHDAEISDPQGRVEALNEAAAALLGADDTRVLELAEAAAQTASQHNYLEGVARATYLLGMARLGRGEGEEALSHLQGALDYFKKLNDSLLTCDINEALGRVFLQLGNTVQAQHHLQTALHLSSRESDKNREARVLNLLGRLNHINGLYSESLRCAYQSLKIYRQLNNKLEEANILCNIGLIQISLGNYPDSLENLSQAYKLLNNEVDSPVTKDIVIINIAHLYITIGEPENALPYCYEALYTTRTKGNGLVEANATLNIGMAQEKLGQNQEAEQSFRNALDLSRTIQYRQGELSALDGLGSLLAKRGQLAEAAAAHAEAAAIAQEIEDLEGELDALNHLGQVQAELGDFPAALASLERALTLAQEADHKKTVYEAHRALAGVYKRAGDFERALRHHELYHEAERALFNEESDKKTRELSAQFDVERARHEAEVQRLQREMAETAREEAEALVRERTHELEQAQVEIVTRLAVAAEYRDDLTGEHTWRVGHVSALVARELGLPDEDVALLRIAARLHDVGKIGIPDAILLKPGKFTPEEHERMKVHTLIGARILSGGHSRLLRMAEEIALSHHERWDGGGYPLGKAGHNIPVTGRIVSVADVFDALTSERPYKQAWARDDALAELRRQAGTQFDPEVVEAAVRVFTREDFARLMHAEAESAARAEPVVPSP